MEKDKKQIRGYLLVSGRVQGVAFRYYSQKIAKKLGITGWVRNCMDGKVEIVAEGEEEKVNQFIDWCHKGPKNAIVKKVEYTREKFKGEFLFFNIR